eukprot:8553382-Karenia_brevis.AAC.1
MAQQESLTLPASLSLTAWKCSTSEFWLDAHELTHDGDFEKMSEAMEIARILDHFPDKIIVM